MLDEKAEIPLWSIVVSGIVIAIMAIAITAFAFIQHQLKVDNAKLVCEKAPLCGDWQIHENVAKAVVDNKGRAELVTALKKSLDPSSGLKEVSVEKKNDGTYRAVVITTKPIIANQTKSYQQDQAKDDFASIVMHADNGIAKKPPTQPQPQQRPKSDGPPSSFKEKGHNDLSNDVKISLKSFPSLFDDEFSLN